MAKKKASSGLLRNGKLIWLAIAVILILVFVGSLQLLRGIFQTETYYVLNQDVPARTEITMEMLEPVVTQAGTGPGGAPGMTQEERNAEIAQVLSSVQSNSVYSRYPLVSGDVLSPSNVGGLTDISQGVPDTWVVTSFGVNADNAVGGRIQRGFYFDMMVVAENGAYYPFVNVLALDTSVSLDGASSADAADTEEAKDGQTQQYVVGMSPENAAKLHDVVNKNSGNIRLVLSPRQNEYAAPQLASYNGNFLYSSEQGPIAPGLIDATDVNGNPILDENGQPVKREATDYTFTDVERDKFGRPISQVENAGEGNAKIEDDGSGDTPDSTSPTASPPAQAPVTPTQDTTDTDITQE